MASKPRKTTADVALDLAKHEVQCAERWKTAFHRFDSIEESVQEINNTLKMSVFAFIGFLATLLITLVTGVFPIT